MGSRKISIVTLAKFLLIFIASHFNDKVNLVQIEDLLFDMENVDVSFNNRKIITATISHNEK